MLWECLPMCKRCGKLSASYRALSIGTMRLWNFFAMLVYDTDEKVRIGVEKALEILERTLEHRYPQNRKFMRGRLNSWRQIVFT